MFFGIAGVAGLAVLLTLVMHYPQYVYIPETGIFLTALGTLMLSLLSIVALMRSLVIERREQASQILKVQVRGDKRTPYGPGSVPECLPTWPASWETGASASRP